MSFDNVIFNVNGSTKAHLIQALVLVRAIQSRDNVKVVAWSYLPDIGLVLYWHAAHGTNVLPAPVDMSTMADIIWDWLQSPDALGMEYGESWDSNSDHDGSNSKGWRVFVEDYGRVGGSPYAICAVRPVYLWHGK